MAGKLTYAQASKRLPRGRKVHTFRNAGVALVGCDWEKKTVLALIKERGAEEAGPAAQALHHGLAVTEADGKVLFIETSNSVRP